MFMENQKNFEFVNDPFLEEIFNYLPPEKPSSDFIKQVMNQIYAHVEPEMEPGKYRKQMLWAYASMAAGLIIIGVIIFAVWPFIEIPFQLNYTSILNLVNYTLSAVDEISRIGDLVQNSTIQISVFFSILILLVIERLIRRDVNKSSIYMF